MNEVVIDTNVLLVADGKHEEVSPQCVVACVERLQEATRQRVVVVDDRYRLISEYRNKLDTKRGKGAGVVFLKWLLQNQANRKHVHRVEVTERHPDSFDEFPSATLEPRFDPADRKFAAVANAHPAKPPIWQAADCKWLDWWQALADAGIRVKFLCPNDVCAFYQSKFPGKPVPALP